MSVAKGILDSGAGGHLGHIESDHVLMGFDFYMYPNNAGELRQYNKVSFQFFLCNTVGKAIECNVTKCGIQMMYD